MTLRFDPFSVARTVALAPVLAPLLAGALALPTGALAAPARHAPVHHASAPAPVPAVAWVALQTDQGRIVVELDGAHAPVSVGNFLHYVDTRHYDGMTFYRAMHLDWGKQPNGLLQGGIRDSRLLFKPIAHEPTNQTGILHKAGTLSLARRAPGTAMADFSILLADMPGLDADPAGTDPDLKLGYAAFGHVVEGMDVVRKIWDQPRSATLGEGVMKGQMLEKPVKVISARRVPEPPPVAAPAPAPAPVP